jgi:hypothetical protein
VAHRTQIRGGFTVIRGLEHNQPSQVIVWTLFLVGYSLWRRALTWPVVLAIVWTTVYWQESMINAANQAFTYNLYFFNRGDWISGLPLMPIHGPTMTQPLKMQVSAFYMLNPLYGMITAGLMLVVGKYLRIHNAMILVLIGVGFGIALDAYSELYGIEAGILAWNRSVPALSIYAGTTQQWPIYEGIMLGTLWALLGILYFFRGGNRFSPWDDGLNFITSTITRNIAVVFMLIGFMNTVFMAYNLVVVGLSMMSPAVSGFPSYLGGAIR